MNKTLPHLLEKLGRIPQPRFTIEEVGDILGLSRGEVLAQIKRGHLPAIKVSARRWGYVLHDDLNAFLTALNGGVR